MLILLGGMIVIFGMIQLSINRKHEAMTGRSIEYFQARQARNIANSAADMAVAELNTDYSWRDGFNNLSLMNGSADVSLTAQGVFRLLITSTGTYNGESVTVNVMMQRDPFSKYSYFTDIEPTIYFISGDTLNGPVHTNGTMHIQGSPVFNGMVTSPNIWEGSGWNGAHTSTDNPEFKKGSDFSHDPVPLPTDVPDLVNNASSGGLKFNEPINVEFNSNGTASISTGTWKDRGYKCIQRSGGKCLFGYYIPAHMEWSTATIYDISHTASFNGVISSSEDVYVKGELNGEITLHSEKDVRISGDITYADDPTQNPNSDDMLGIVSGGDVVVESDADRDHGNSDLTIQASIMAMGSSFRVEGYNDHRNRGQLRLLGGLIQKERGPVGLVNGSGFSKRYTYDDRFLDKTTPGFPRENLYSLVYWKE